VTHPRRSQCVVEWQSCADGDHIFDVLRDADEDDRRAVVFEPEDPRRVRAEQVADFFADGREDLDRAHAPRHQRRHPPQRGLLLREPCASFIRDVELGRPLGHLQLELVASVAELALCSFPLLYEARALERGCGVIRGER
jgi:hypothetical protein